MNATLPTNRPMELAVANFFPMDLSEWMTREYLLSLVRSTAQEFAWEQNDESGCSKSLENDSSQRTLAVLIWCYATSRYATTELPECVDADPFFRVLPTGSCAGARKIRLFRSQNRELLKHCLARVLERAWIGRQNAVNGSPGATAISASGQKGLAHTLAFRKLFHAEAEARLRRAIAADLRPLSMSAQSSTTAATVARDFGEAIKLTARFHRQLLAVTCFVLLGCLPLVSHADERLESVTIDGKIYKNVRVCKVTPVDLVIRLENGGAITLKRQELPEELVAKYPYDPEEAAAFEKRQAAERKTREDQARAETRKSLKRQEQLVKSRIASLQEDLVELQKEIAIFDEKARGQGPKSSERQQLNHAQDQKLDLLRQLREQNGKLKTIRAAQQQVL